jgi:hypothetical protein
MKVLHEEKDDRSHHVVNHAFGIEEERVYLGADNHLLLDQILKQNMSRGCRVGSLCLGLLGDTTARVAPCRNRHIFFSLVIDGCRTYGLSSRHC